MFWMSTVGCIRCPDLIFFFFATQELLTLQVEPMIIFKWHQEVVIWQVQDVLVVVVTEVSKRTARFMVNWIGTVPWIYVVSPKNPLQGPRVSRVNEAVWRGGHWGPQMTPGRGRGLLDSFGGRFCFQTLECQGLWKPLLGGLGTWSNLMSICFRWVGSTTN